VFHENCDDAAPTVKASMHVYVPARRAGRLTANSGPNNTHCRRSIPRSELSERPRSVRLLGTSIRNECGSYGVRR
jgi:hypothetical protein